MATAFPGGEDEAPNTGGGGGGGREDEALCDPDSKDSFQEVLCKTFASLLVGAVDDVVQKETKKLDDKSPPSTGGRDWRPVSQSDESSTSQAATRVGSGPGEDDIDADAVADGQTSRRTSSTAGADSSGWGWLNALVQKGQTALVKVLFATVGLVLKNHRAQLEKALSKVAHLGLEKLKTALGMLFNNERRFNWGYMLALLALCYLILKRERESVKQFAGDIKDIVMFIAQQARDFIVGWWRQAFLDLGGWVGFKKSQGEQSVELADRAGNALKVVFFITLIGGGFYYAWKG